MPAKQAKVTYKKTSEKSSSEKHAEFFVLVESEEAVLKYRKDPSTAYINVVQTDKVYVTQAGGNEGIYTAPSDSQLQNDFNTTSREEVIMFILKNGDIKGINAGKDHGGSKDRQSLTRA